MEALSVEKIKALQEGNVEQFIIGRLHHKTGQYGSYWKLVDGSGNEIDVKFWKDCEPKGIPEREDRVVTIIPKGGKNITWKEYNGKYSLNINPGYKLQVDSDGDLDAIDVPNQTNAPADEPRHYGGKAANAQAKKDLHSSADPSRVIDQKLALWALCWKKAQPIKATLKLSDEQAQALVSSLYISGEKENVDKHMNDSQIPHDEGEDHQHDKNFASSGDKDDIPF